MARSEVEMRANSLYGAQLWLRNPEPIIKSVFATQSVSSFSISQSNIGLCISELPFCPIMEEIALPPGFKSISVTKGLVKIFGDDGLFRRTHSHSFAKDDFNNVLCLTFAQFFSYQREDTLPKIPGLRIKQYREKAPELIYYLGSGIAALCGDADEVSRKLHIQYGMSS